MDIILNLPNIVKLLIELIIFIIFFLSYIKLYKELTIKICNSYSSVSANDYLSLIKLFTKISLLVVFGLYVFFTPNIYHIFQFIITWLMFITLLLMTKMSSNLMEYLIDFKFNKTQITETEYYSLVGSIELINGVYVFSYLPGRFEIDIEKKNFV